MPKCKLEYIWLDGHLPTQKMRSKTKIIENFSGNAQDAPMWSFDGSSTYQAEGGSSDLLLKPVRAFLDPARDNAYLVICEVLNADQTPHPTNGRATIHDDNNDFWFGFEQEYVLWDLNHHTPYGFPAPGYYPPPQGPFYCSVGAEYNIGREIVEEHLDICIKAGLNIEGINAEVMKGQWEYQIFAKGAKEAGDQLWAARYLLERIGEQHNIRINLDPKPVSGDWNGSGMHCNFSNDVMRTCGDKEIYNKICSAFGTQEAINRHIKVYGENNHLRLTGKHETQSIDKFNCGISDRGASIRIPIATVQAGYNGYLEDRRPASNADPYKVAAVIIDTIKAALK
ncbi:MAG: glutamine synthetase [Ignavibacteriae bacterium]|nr:MAG: glutamine synthetase [Ignavibacteriota bacterium]